MEFLQFDSRKASVLRNRANTSNDEVDFEHYESSEINWFPLDADLSIRTKEISDNKKALNEFLNRKEVEREETAKELFDD